MKFLILFACSIPYIIVATILSANGLTLGPIPAVILYFICYAVARHFWGVYAKKKEAKEASKPKDEEK